MRDLPPNDMFALDSIFILLDPEFKAPEFGDELSVILFGLLYYCFLSAFS